MNLLLEFGFPILSIADYEEGAWRVGHGDERNEVTKQKNKKELSRNAWDWPLNA